MRLLGKSGPAVLWRAFCFLLLLATGAMAATPPSRPPDLAQVGLPDEAEAARLLQQFRRMGLAERFYLEFEFRALPRRGEERIFTGRLWGGRVGQGISYRLEVDVAAGAPARWLLLNGEKSMVWRLHQGRGERMSAEQSIEPLLPGLEISPFDLQMPFLHWPQARLEKLTRSTMNRPAYVYLFPAPPEFAAKVSAARAYLDTQFNALMQTEIVAADGRLAKSFAILSLIRPKKEGERYLPKQVDYRNELTRDKTRLQITAAALDIVFPAATLLPEGLAETLPPPPAEVLLRIDP